MSRIGIIREAIVKRGGVGPTRCNHDYYHDGPRSVGFRNNNIVRIKVDSAFDGLTLDQRLDVADELSKHPDVERAYISRRASPRDYYTVASRGEHLIVLFNGVTDQAKKALQTRHKGYRL